MRLLSEDCNAPHKKNATALMQKKELLRFALFRWVDRTDFKYAILGGLIFAPIYLVFPD